MSKIKLLSLALLILAVIFFRASIYDLYFNLITDKYGNKFNEERKKRGVPILDNKWQMTAKSPKEGIVFWKPINKKNIEHESHSVYVDAWGKICYESDFYVKPSEGDLERKSIVWIIYNYEDNSFRVNWYNYEDSSQKDDISLLEVDSILNSWGLSRLNY